MALRYDQTEAWALYRQISRTGQDIRDRRLTAAGGMRRVERLALAVAVAKAPDITPDACKELCSPRPVYSWTVNSCVCDSAPAKDDEKACAQ